VEDDSVFMQASLAVEEKELEDTNNIVEEERES